MPEAPEEELRRVVELMATVHRDGAQIREETLACREVAAKARRQAAALKSRAIAARAVRERIQKYAIYWRWISPNWTYEEVWKGKITVRRVGLENIEITSSDDEQMEAMMNEREVEEEEEGEEGEARSGQLCSYAFTLSYRWSTVIHRPRREEMQTSGTGVHPLTRKILRTEAKVE